MFPSKQRELTSEERIEIVVLHKQKNSLRKIAALVRRPLSTVADTVKRYKNTNSVANLKRSGRPTKINNSDSRYLKLCSIRSRRKTLSVITEEFNIGHKISASRSVVNRALHSWGMLGRVACRKPLLSPRNIKKRLLFAKEHVKWKKKQWAKVLFTDESKFDLFGSKRRTYVRRFKNERFESNCLIPTVKHGGGNVMIWGGICVNGVTRLKRIEGIMDKKVYHSILVHRALPEGKKLLGKGFVFQEDNDPKHSSLFCRNYLASKEKSGSVINLIYIDFLVPFETVSIM